MNCRFTEKVSLLIDDELPDTEASRLRAHISGCIECGRRLAEFRRVRDVLADYPLEAASVPEPIARAAISTGPWWRRRISVPVPVAALLFSLLMVPPLTSLLTSGHGPAQSPDPTPTTREETNLSRFDHGERTVIFTERRSGTVSNSDSETNQ